LRRNAAKKDIEWDEAKNITNQARHHVSFEEAATVFGDPLELTISDPDHSIREYRFVSVGESFRRRLLVVSYIERSDAIRIISARKPNKRERHWYEEG